MQDHTIFEQIEAVFPRLAGRAYRVFPELPEDLTGVGAVRVEKFKAIAIAHPLSNAPNLTADNLPGNLNMEFGQEFELYAPWTIFTNKVQLSQAKNRVFQENLGEPSIEVRLDHVARGRIGWGKQVGVIMSVEIFGEALETLSVSALRAEFLRLLEDQLYSHGAKRTIVPMQAVPVIELERLGYQAKAGFMQKSAPPARRRERSPEPPAVEP